MNVLCLYLITEIELWEAIGELVRHSAHFVSLGVKLVAQHIRVLGLMKDDAARSERRDGVQFELGGGGAQLLAEILEVSARGVGQELEQVIVKTLGARPVDDHVWDGQNLDPNWNSLNYFSSNT